MECFAGKKVYTLLVRRREKICDAPQPLKGGCVVVDKVMVRFADLG